MEETAASDANARMFTTHGKKKNQGKWARVNNRIALAYTEGRGEHERMDDVQAPPPGTLGEIRGVDDAGSILTVWQTGSTLSLIPGVDSFRIIKEAEQDG